MCVHTYKRAHMPAYICDIYIQSIDEIRTSRGEETSFKITLTFAMTQITENPARQHNLTQKYVCLRDSLYLSRQG